MEQIKRGDRVLYKRVLPYHGGHPWEGRVGIVDEMSGGYAYVIWDNGPGYPQNCMSENVQLIAPKVIKGDDDDDCI